MYEVIISPKMQTKNYKDFCPNKQTRIIGKKPAYLHSPKNHQKKCYDPCLFCGAKILVIFGLHCGRKDDLINSFGI